MENYLLNRQTTIWSSGSLKTVMNPLQMSYTLSESHRTLAVVSRITETLKNTATNCNTCNTLQYTVVVTTSLFCKNASKKEGSFSTLCKKGGGAQSVYGI